MPTLSNLVALSPLDGRYCRYTRELAKYFSEFALIRYRVRVEIEYLLALLKFTHLANLSAKQTKRLRSMASSFSLADARAVKAHELKCHHDVKAVEYFLRDKFVDNNLEHLLSYIHFGLTSEDTNSLAYGLALKQSREKVILPALWQVMNALAGFVKTNADLPMLARTHGQPAVPTTLGKEYAVFLSRLIPELKLLAELTFAAKLSGAVGTYAAQNLAFPDLDWPSFSRKFLSQLGLVADPLSTQIVSPESYSRYFQTLQRINNILLDCVRDSWQYIADGWLVQQIKEGEVGSSTMPQKVNPIDFENAEGNFGLANSLLAHFGAKLPISRLQRDLSDSTLKRSFGTALGHALLGYQAILRGLGKLRADKLAIQNSLQSHPEIISESLQTLLRADGMVDAYEVFKVATRGKKHLTAKQLCQLASKKAKTAVSGQKIASLSLKSYTGLATLQVRKILALAAATKKKGQYASSSK